MKRDSVRPVAWAPPSAVSAACPLRTCRASLGVAGRGVSGFLSTHLSFEFLPNLPSTCRPVKPNSVCSDLTSASLAGYSYAHLGLLAPVKSKLRFAAVPALYACFPGQLTALARFPERDGAIRGCFGRLSDHLTEPVALLRQ